MIRCEAKQGSRWVIVTFTVAENGVDGEVALVGDFNRWEPTATPMRGHGGARMASVTVEAGRRYAFRYLAEGGTWFNDEAAHDYQPNEYGGSDGVIDLSMPP